MIYQEKTMKSEKIYEGKILNLRVDTIELPDKKYSKREIIEHPGGVAIIAIDKDKNLVMIKQYRKAVEEFIWEIPAGRLEVNEEPRETAIRELKEETGYAANKMTYITEFYTTPGYCSEKIYLFLAEDLIEGEPCPDLGENIEMSNISIDNLLKMATRGEIVDSKTIAAIYIAERYLQEK